jgi:iron complex transport system permease protein
VKTLTPRRLAALVGASAAVLGLAVLVAPEFGSADASLWRVITGTAGPDERTIVLSLRLPRAILAALAGGTLAACGASMQAILGNPLASPYTLGLAGGASFAAVLTMKLGLGIGFLGGAAVPVAAFLGALVAAATVWALARLGRRGHMTPEGLLLAGVTLGFIASAGVLVVQYVSEPLDIARMVRWMMGGLGVVGYGVILAMAPVLLPGLALLFMQVGKLNQIAFSEEFAASRGVDVRRVRLVVLFGTALATGAVVAAAGPIAFVGLIVPHAVRFLGGPDHRSLLPCSFLCGGAFLVVCDTVARSVTPPSEIPVGVLTALLGGPFFLWMLATRRR